MHARTRRHPLTLPLSICTIVAALALAAGAAAQTSGRPERYTAMAVSMGGPGPAGASTVEITVSRWSSDAERDRLLNVLMTQGADKLLEALQKEQRVGFIRTPNSLGYDLHYAHRTPLPEGGERIVIATDRRIGFWEAANSTRSLDYPFTVIELHLNADGQGEGKLSLATKIIPEKESRTIVLENWGTQPVLLQSVRREEISK